MNAVIIAVGDELLAGQTIDSNSAYLARELLQRGVEPVAHWTVGDCRGAIASALRKAAERAEVVLVSGGLGPTADDVTRHGLADAMGCELVLNERCLETLEEFFARRSRTMIPANRIQAMIPARAEPLENELGTAAGIAASLTGAQVFVMPGVPHEMRRMFEKVVAPRLRGGRRVILHQVVHCFGLGESDIAARIAELMKRTGSITVGTSVSAGTVSVRITARADRRSGAERRLRQTVSRMRQRLGELVVGEGEATMASAVGDLLRARGETLAAAESCTGGLLGEMITSVAGSSDYYLGGVIAYANEAKRDLLGVADELLARHGAVSEPVASAMAAGCRERLRSDWALGITGIAGPGGGDGGGAGDGGGVGDGDEDEKPVGLVYVALAGPQGAQVHRHVFPGTRGIIRRRAATAALDYLRLALM